MDILESSALTVISNNVPASYADWDSGTSYSVDDKVVRNGLVLKARLASTNKDPLFYSASFGYSLRRLYNVWSSDKTYNSGDIVLFETSTQFSTYISDGQISSPIAETRNLLPSTVGVYYQYIMEATATTTESPYILLSGQASSNWKHRGYEWVFDSVDNSSAALYDPTVPTSILNSPDTFISYSGTITLEIDASNTNTLFTYGMSGTDVTYSLIDKTTSEVYYMETRQLYSRETTGFFSYLFGGFTFGDQRDLIEYPIKFNSKMKIEITPRDNDARISIVSIGKKRTLGVTQYGVQLGIEDYSTKDTDDSGRTILTEGRYKDTAQAIVYIDQSSADAVKRVLTSYRATPLVFIVAEEIETSILYGFIRDFELSRNSWNDTRLTIEIESL